MKKIALVVLALAVAACSANQSSSRLGAGSSSDLRIVVVTNGQTASVESVTPIGGGGPGPGPVPTPKPPVPPSSDPCTAAGYTRDQILTSKLTDGWGVLGLSIPDNKVMKFCVPAYPPYLPADKVPSRIMVSWYDESDRDCGALTMSVQQTTGAKQLKDSGPSGLSNGGVNFIKRVGRIDDPTRVAPGAYLVTVEGHPTPCSRYMITWGWQ